MKLRILLVMLSVFIFTISIIEAEKTHSSFVKVIYFHTDYRCSTCNKLEKYSKESVEKNFSKEIKSGKVIWEAINFEKEENEKYVEKFELYNKALILVKYENGKQKEWKNLKKIWELVNDKSKYYTYVKNEVNKILKDS